MKYFFEKHSLLDWSRYGFRQAHSTQHVVLDMKETIQTDMDEKICSCGVFIVNHRLHIHILLDKLNYYGLRGILNQWLSSYLSHRTQLLKLTLIYLVN